MTVTIFCIFSLFSVAFSALQQPPPTEVTENEIEDADALSHGKVVVCYISTWARYRKDKGQFTIDDIDPNLCTHLIYAFAGLNPNNFTIKVLDPYNDLPDNYGLASYQKMTSLKNKYPHLKVSLAIGGWTEGSANYSTLAADPEKRRIFTQSVIRLIKEHNFDGLDLDWEYPAKRGGRPEDKQNFVELIKDLRKELVPGRYLLTAALGAAMDTIDNGYDLLNIYNELDFLHIMSYDYHGLWEPSTGANSPLRSADGDTLSVEWTVNHLLKNGAGADKLVLGVPLYGRSFTLVEGEAQDLGEPSIPNMGLKGQFTNTEGFLGYNEICLSLTDEEWKEHWDDLTMTPFISRGRDVITYDDKDSITEKVRFAMKKGLAGIMVWSMDTDDFRGLCANGPYPLMRAINTAMLETATTPSSGSLLRISPVLLLISWAMFFVCNRMG